MAKTLTGLGFFVALVRVVFVVVKDAVHRDRSPADRRHDRNPAEGIWSVLQRAMVNFAGAGVDGLVRMVKRKLKKIQYRPA